MNKSIPNFVALALIQGIGTSAWAQQPPTKDWASELLDITQTDHIQAASKRIQDIASAPVDVIILRSNEIKALGYRTLGDALGGIVGFRTNNTHANQFLGSRGLPALADSNTRILVLLDGHTLNVPSGAGFSNVGEDLGLPMELVDRIEVVRGPASCLYGNNAYQALVNVVTVGAAGTSRSTFEGATSAGSGGLGELWVRGALKTGGVKTDLTLSGFQRTGESRTYPQLRPDALPEDLDREERQSGFLRVQGGNWSLQGFVMSRTQWLASVPLGGTVGEPAFARHRRLGGEFRWEPTLGQVHWNFRLYGDRASFDSEAILDPARTNGVGGGWKEDNPNYTIGTEIQGRMQLNSDLDLTFGTEQSRNHFNGRSSWEENQSFVTTRVGYDVGNSYLETQWRPSNKWTFVFGIQHATWRARYAESETPLISETYEEETTKRFTPRFSAVWEVGHGQTLKFVYGQGFRLPTLLERYATDFSTFRANPNLRAEILNNFQGIWSSKWSPTLRTQLVAGYYQSEHAIAAIGGGSTPGMYVNSPNCGYGKSLEGESNFIFGKTNVYVGFGWYRLTTLGINADNLSPYNGNIKITHQYKQMSFAGEARYVSGRTAHSTGSDVPANWTLRASTRFDAPHYWVQLTVEDITDSQRRDLVGKEFSPITWMEGDGRSVRGTLGFRF